MFWSSSIHIHISNNGVNFLLSFLDNVCHSLPLLLIHETAMSVTESGVMVSM